MEYSWVGWWELLRKEPKGQKVAQLVGSWLPSSSYSLPIYDDDDYYYYYYYTIINSRLIASPKCYCCRRTHQFLGPMISEKRQLVTDELVEFEKKPVEVQGFRNITNHFRGIYGILYLNLIYKNRRM